MSGPLHLSRRSHLGVVDQEALEEARRFATHRHPLDLRCSNPQLLGFDWSLPGASPREEVSYEPAPRGTEFARLAVAKAYAKRAPVSIDQVLLTASTSEAYSYLFLALCDPGDSVLVPRPSYPLFQDLAQLAGVRLGTYSLRYDGEWHLDLGSLPPATRLAQERFRMVLCVSPNNPTGNVVQRAELEALLSLGLPLVIDEVFRPYLLSAAKLPVEPLDSVGSAPVILLDGLSKRACAPGRKLAWMLARGPGSRELLDRVEWIADSYLSVNAASQRSLPETLAAESAIQEKVRRRIDRNLASLKRLTADSAVSVLHSTGGWSKILRLPAVLSERKWSRRLIDAGIRVERGSLYELPFDAAFVLSLLTREADWESGLLRLLSVVERELA